MAIERFLVYGLAAIFFVVALARLRRSNVLKASKVQGNIVVGNQSGHLTQTYSEMAAPSGKEGPSRTAPHGDRVAWVIGIVGALIAAAQLVHDIRK
ncbi:MULTISPECIES: hypothetical protein [Paraburkholderia]|uniref:Uncharacterized protein n=1 Tax=Paraburkholderia youngii TaxID=2782701 RepID=A0A7W8LA38_9BURK|nr:hypothetical protein [Paraburkholderia youngii]MBB5402893.1 hypothetical protein [Paraburkholderia youngii]NVI05140.1 hypothetical protein [Paraburkholderia youngii]